MNFNIYDRLKDSSYSDGKFLSDKSYAYDTVYFISKFIIGFCQTVISIYSVQWCIFFSQERERLDKTS